MKAPEAGTMIATEAVIVTEITTGAVIVTETMTEIVTEIVIAIETEIVTTMTDQDLAQARAQNQTLIMSASTKDCANSKERVLLLQMLKLKRLTDAMTRQRTKILAPSATVSSKQIRPLSVPLREWIPLKKRLVLNQKPRKKRNANAKRTALANVTSYDAKKRSTELPNTLSPSSST